MVKVLLGFITVMIFMGLYLLVSKLEKRWMKGLLILLLAGVVIKWKLVIVPIIILFIIVVMIAE